MGGVLTIMGVWLLVGALVGIGSWVRFTRAEKDQILSQWRHSEALAVVSWVVMVSLFWPALLIGALRRD